MPRKKLSRNAPCPCGSGKKSKSWGWGKRFEWVEDEAGTVFRSTHMTPDVLRRQFVAKHGREPGPDDLLFPDMRHPEPLEATMVEDMKAADRDPAFIYAFEKTGLLHPQRSSQCWESVMPKRLAEAARGLLAGKSCSVWSSVCRRSLAGRSLAVRPRVSFDMGMVALPPACRTLTSVELASPKGVKRGPTLLSGVLG
jgi:hypothetical protein